MLAKRRHRSNVSPRDRVRSEDILFEIGCEELPATNLADIFENAPLNESLGRSENILETRLRKILEEKRITFTRVFVWATPRRVVCRIEGAAESQAPQENLIKGPSKEVAFSPDGKPTEKLLGFLKAKGASLEEVQISSHQGKDYICVKRSESVKGTSALLPEIVEQFVRSPLFPKNMRWDGSGLYFPRPIRSVLCFYGPKSVRFKLGTLEARNETFIFSKGERKPYRVKDITSYFKTLQKNGVILDPQKRGDVIFERLKKSAALLKGNFYQGAFLLSEVKFLVENPEVISASFSEEFLKLPKDVLTVSMARKQRIFGLEDSVGRMLPHFLGILDGAATAEEKKVISKNYEHILHAKLKDSLFFYNEDIKIPLERRREELKGLIFLKGAGSMLEKSERLVNLAKKLEKEFRLSRSEQQALERAAFLSKADLLTQMVGEFPELQGIMGEYYAIENGESSEIAQAIGEQYRPRTMQAKTTQDLVPFSHAGSVLSILDKCDLIVACFGLGLEPSSSADPYGLRRSASAIVKIALDRKIGFSLKTLLAETKKEMGRYLLKDKEENLEKRLGAFFRDRLKAVLLDMGYKDDLAEAVLSSGFDGFNETRDRLQALSEISSQTYFIEANKVVERTSNILKGNKERLENSIAPELLTEDLEKRVFEHYERSRQDIEKATEAGDFKLATSLYAGAFFDILGEFFEKVFVNAEDAGVRRNRLLLLRSINELYTKKIADLSRIQTTHSPN